MGTCGCGKPHETLCTTKRSTRTNHFMHHIHVSTRSCSTRNTTNLYKYVDVSHCMQHRVRRTLHKLYELPVHLINILNAHV